MYIISKSKKNKKYTRFSFIVIIVQTSEGEECHLQDEASSAPCQDRSRSTTLNSASSG